MKKSEINPHLFPSIPTPSIGEHIDNGFYAITVKQATKLAKASKLKRLPKAGHECLVDLDGHTWWLAQTCRSVRLERGTPVWDPEQVWSIRHYSLLCLGCKEHK